MNVFVRVGRAYLASLCLLSVLPCSCALLATPLMMAFFPQCSAPSSNHGFMLSELHALTAQVEESLGEESPSEGASPTSEAARHKRPCARGAGAHVGQSIRRSPPAGITKKAAGRLSGCSVRHVARCQQGIQHADGIYLA